MASSHYTVKDVMEALLDITLAVLGALGEGSKPGKTLVRLHTTEVVGIAV